MFGVVYLLKKMVKFTVKMADVFAFVRNNVRMFQVFRSQ